MPDETYTVNGTNGYLTHNDTTLEIHVSGAIPSAGSVELEKNNIKNACLKFGDYAVPITNGTVGEAVKGSCNGTSVVSSGNSGEQEEQNNNTQYTITFNYNNGNPSTSETISLGSTVTKPSDPTKDDYTFVAWYYDAELENEFDFTTSITSNMTLYAKWQLDPYSMTAMCPGCVFSRDYSWQNINQVLTAEIVNSYSEFSEGDSFLGYIVENGVMTRAFVCGIENNKAFCLDGGNPSANYSNNVDILHHFFPKNNWQEWPDSASGDSIRVATVTDVQNQVTGSDYNCFVANPSGGGLADC